ncbi:MAG: hypothetical protein CRU78_20530 [Candidatus Accumulibacter phosphatis]|uniref:Uncharacterized protein n=1 Tax=Candidatus Accumulibacter phosphatis TaxID=327160 RepID=A0A6A7S033_9PROT|nr:hypothetical protein [Candidatus Accumulibacter phosphatis]
MNHHPARSGRDPRTGATVQVPEKQVLPLHGCRECRPIASTRYYSVAFWMKRSARIAYPPSLRGGAADAAIQRFGFSRCE